MKYNCTNEFDLNLIYQKLTAQSTIQMVKANQFFQSGSKNTLRQFQQKMSELIPITIKK